MKELGKACTPQTAKELASLEGDARDAYKKGEPVRATRRLPEEAGALFMDWMLAVCPDAQMDFYAVPGVTMPQLLEQLCPHVFASSPSASAHCQVGPVRM